MAKFTKYNNPNKKRVKRKKSYDQKLVEQINSYIIDKNLDYNININYYIEKVK